MYKIYFYSDNILQKWKKGKKTADPAAPPSHLLTFANLQGESKQSDWSLYKMGREEEHEKFLLPDW